jgi:hypothetical protein
MLDSPGKKCDLHIRTAGIFLMQLELLETQRLTALCHNEVANLDEECVLATAQELRPAGGFIRMPGAFPVCHRTKDAVSPASAPRAARR